MSAEIYYFSGTGNSLVVARDIAKKLNGEMISISSVIDKKSITPLTDVVGIVFPVYYEPHGGVPLIVRRFVKKLENIAGKYIFAICTYGAVSVNALNFLEKLIQSRGAKINAGFTVNMPNNLTETKNNPKKQEKMFHVWEENKDFIFQQIKNREEGRFGTPNVTIGKFYGLIKFIAGPLSNFYEHPTLRELKKYPDLSDLPYTELLPHMDKTFNTNANCIGCGTCSQICPAQNIEIIDGKPSWQQTCEFCLACIHWCKKEAITSSVLKNIAKYHHPQIKISDMLEQPQVLDQPL